MPDSSDQQNPDPQTPPPAAPAPGGELRIEDLPESWQREIRDLREESKNRRLQLREMEQRLQEVSQADQARLAEQGQWKTLAEQRQQELTALKPYRERAEALEAMIRKSNEARIARVREDMRPLIPADYPPERLSEWLDANLERLTTRPAPDLDAGAGGGGGKGGSSVQVTDEDRRAAELAQAQGFTNVTPEAVAKRRMEKRSQSV